MSVAEIIAAVFGSSLIYFSFAMAVYAITVHVVEKFHGVENFWRNWNDWKKAYNRRKGTQPDNKIYPQLRRDERWEAVRVTNQVFAALVFLFWPLFLAFGVLYGVYTLVKTFLTIFSNAFKIIDSLKGE